MKTKWFVAVAMILLVACGSSSDADESIRKNAVAFADSYFNLDFHAALDLSTSESRKWICYVASNVSEADLEVLRSYGHDATVNVERVEVIGDTAAVVKLSVDGFLCTDSIGRPGHIVDGAIFSLPMVRRGDRWLVRMASPLQSEK